MTKKLYLVVREFEKGGDYGEHIVTDTLKKAFWNKIEAWKYMYDSFTSEDGKDSDEVLAYGHDVMVLVTGVCHEKRITYYIEEVEVE